MHSGNPILPLPPFYEASKIEQVWRVPYQERANQAQNWAYEYHINPAYQDKFKITLVMVDVQNTFCLPDFELFVAGRSGRGALDDNRRLVEFIYHNLDHLTHLVLTLDTHQAIQIFHSIFLVDKDGNHPAPFTQVTIEDINLGRWKFNSAIAGSLGIQTEYGQQHLMHYAQELKERGKYTLTIWPYHAMLGGIGYALVSVVEEAVFFHTIARQSQPDFDIKGNNPLTEHYSTIGTEVITGPDGKLIGGRSDKLIQHLMTCDAMIIAGQAKSHCVAWTVTDLLSDIQAIQPELAKKVYLLDDCSSPVVISGVVDYTEQAETAYQTFAFEGMHIVKSTTPILNWPGIQFPNL